MKIAIVGFPRCGKSTCFKAITGKAKDGKDPDPTKPHLGDVKIHDQRLEKLKEIFKPKKLTPADIVFEDMPGFHIPQIKDVDALVEVLGLFEGRDPVKDMENMDLEFMLADLEIINKRLSSLEKELKAKGASGDKAREREALVKCKEALEKSTPLRNIELTNDEKKELRGFQFLSRKPIFILGNIEEGGSRSEAVKKMQDSCNEKNIKGTEFCAKLEAEIADLEESERGAFLKEMGIENLAREAVIKMAYEALGYITFFTVRGEETRAWPVKNGTNAVGAAGKIHTDMQKGFIKAEIVNFKDLAVSGSFDQARKKGLLRLEPKEYKIQDGDIVDFRFSK